MPSKQLPIAGVIATGLALVLSQNAYSQVLYGTAGSTYSQNFDSLPNTPENVNLQTFATPTQWADNSTSTSSQISLTGWYLYHPITNPGSEGGANGHQRIRIGSGSASTGAFMSFGSTGSSDRALGDVGSTTIAANNADVYIGLRIKNTTGQTLDSFTLTYNGEQWRDGGNATPVAQSMTFGWSTTATAINDLPASFTTVATLGYDSPVFTAAAGAVDGNVAGRVNGITATVTGLNWLDGTDLWLRWDDVQNAGNDHGLAIDDVNFTGFATVPEPTTWAVFTMGVLAFVGFRRRKK
jgi:PEP-CTERM motif